MGGEAFVLGRVGNQKETVALDGIGAEASLAADAGRLHAEARFEEKPLLADEGQRCDRCAVHARGQLDEAVEIDVGRRVEYGVLLQGLEPDVLVGGEGSVVASGEHQVASAYTE